MDDIHVALQSLLLLARMEELRAGSAADYSGAALDWDIPVSYTHLRAHET